MVVGHYLDSEIKDIEAIVAHASRVVAEDGFFPSMVQMLLIGTLSLKKRLRLLEKIQHS